MAQLRAGRVAFQSQPDLHVTKTKGNDMSEPKKERPAVPEGASQYLKTRQMKPNEKGFVGYETEWESFQKEVKYETPKKP
jgi:hypothetical protein